MPTYRTPLEPHVLGHIESLLNSRTDKSGGFSACWPWTGARDGDGYGRVSILGKRYRAHRVTWEYANLCHVPDGLLVRHLCPGGGNPWCCNPFHLIPGTVQDNSDDMTAAGRQARGEQVANAKLTADQVLEIRRRYLRGDTQASLATEFGIALNLVSLIVKGKVWKHIEVDPRLIDVDPNTRKATGDRHGGTKLTHADVVLIKQRLRDGHSQSEVSRDYGVSSQCIWSIARGETWKHVPDRALEITLEAVDR